MKRKFYWWHILPIAFVLWFGLEKIESHWLSVTFGFAAGSGLAFWLDDLNAHLQRKLERLRLSDTRIFPSFRGQP